MKLKASQVMFLKSILDVLQEPSLEVLTKLDTVEKRLDKFEKENAEKLQEGKDFETDIKDSLFKEFTEDDLVNMIPINTFNRGQRKELYKILQK